MTGNISKTISSLPEEIRRHISILYNWNRSLIPALEAELESCEQLRNEDKENEPGFAQDGFEPLMDRLKWWIHLIKTDGSNWRLPAEAYRIIDELEDFNLNELADRLAQVLQYNWQFFEQPPVL